MTLPQTNSSATNTDWLTPLSIIEALGRFDLDPCCPPVMPWETPGTGLGRIKDILDDLAARLRLAGFRYCDFRAL